MADTSWSYSDGGSWDPATTRYVQMRSATGPYYDRQTGSVVSKSSGGSFLPYPNQTSAKQTFEQDIKGINSAGPIGSARQTPAEAAAALTTATLDPNDSGFIPINANRPTRTPKATAGKGDPGVLRYPSSPHSINADSDYIVFEFFKYSPPFGRALNETDNTTANSGYQLYQSSQERSYQRESPLKPIILYMPEDIQAQYTAKWGGAGFGAAAAGLSRIAGTQGGAIPTAFETATGMIKTATYDALLKGINAFTGSNINIDQFLGGVSGTIINPNVEMMYQAPDLRNLSFKFKMTPKSETEAKSIREICTRFKKAMLPTFGGQAIFGIQESAPNLLTIPDLCQVTYMQGSKPHPYLPRYKLCAITGVDINYTPDGAYATYEGGSPVATEISISLVETKVIFADEIAENSGDNY